ARYLFPLYSGTTLGLETGYAYFNVDHTHLKADTVVNGTSPVTVEYFTTRSKGFILLNLVFGMWLQPNLNLNVFGGPAWLNNKYIDNDVIDGFTPSTAKTYQLTADAGMELDWYFSPFFAAGMRFDYIFDTGNRTISNAGSTTAIDGI